MNRRSMNFETALERLEQIVAQLEQGDAPLQEALKLFREGTALVQTCTKQLEKAELEVVKLTSGTNGEPREEALDDEDSE